MARKHSEPGKGPLQHDDRDRVPNGTPEEVRESSRKAQKELNTPKEQPDHIQPEPNKDFSHNQK